MIDIGSADFLVNVPSLQRKEFKFYSTNLFDEWEKSVEQTLTLTDYSISLEIEEGSIKGAGKIAVALGTLYFGIGNYGDFISGLETRRKQVSYVSNALFKSARSPFGCSNVDAKVRRNGGTLSHLHRLFDKVQRGVVTPDEAMIEVQMLLGEDGESVPEFIRELRLQFENAPRHPKQLSLIDEEWEECVGEPTDGKKRSPRTPSPKPIPLYQHYRIEIWRESKKDKKHVRVTGL